MGDGTFNNVGRWVRTLVAAVPLDLLHHRKGTQMDISPYDAKIKIKKTVKLDMPDSLVYSTASIMGNYLTEVGRMLPSGSFDESTMEVIKYWSRLAELVNEA